VIRDFRCDKASLTLLRLLRAAYAKIDGSIVRRLRYSAAARAAVETVLKVLASSGIETIAESVEDEETLSVVRQLGVDYAQGLIASSPLCGKSD
jgi:EAL domain-containing protein (putative c-di-GMP-specific phosphodiesterase class I)